MREHLAAIHRGTALVLLNLVLVFLGANGLVLVYEAFKPPRPKPAVPPQQRSILSVYQTGALKYGLDRLRRVYPSMSDEQVIRLVLESWNVQIICDRRTFYTEEPFEGYYVNVDGGGFRRGANQGPWPPDRKAFNIFVFGGSTTFGYGVADDQTIPSQLQDIVRQKLGRADVYVYNFGHSFFFSLQERMAFEASLDRGLVPDLVIFVDGLNEFYHWNGQPTMRPCVDPGDLWQRLRETVRCRGDELCWPLQRLATRWRILRPPALAPLGGTAAPPTPPPADDVAVNRAVVERWIANKRAIEELAQRHGVEVVFVRQPVPTYAYDRAHHLFPDDLEQHARSGRGYAVWEEMLQEDRERRWSGNLLDLSRLGEGREAPLYVDAVHYTPAFALEIASEIAQRLAARQMGRMSSAGPQR